MRRSNLLDFDFMQEEDGVGAAPYEDPKTEENREEKPREDRESAASAAGSVSRDDRMRVFRMSYDHEEEARDTPAPAPAKRPEAEPAGKHAYTDKIPQAAHEVPAGDTAGYGGLQMDEGHRAPEARFQRNAERRGREERGASEPHGEPGAGRDFRAEEQPDDRNPGGRRGSRPDTQRNTDRQRREDAGWQNADNGSYRTDRGRYEDTRYGGDERRAERPAREQDMRYDGSTYRDRGYADRRRRGEDDYTERSMRSEGETADGQEYRGHRHVFRQRRLEQPDVGYDSIRSLVVAIHSPKGGVGKTTITKELAFGFASCELNGRPLKVLVIDADWEFGDVATQFDVRAEPNVSRWVNDMLLDAKASGKIPLYDPMEIKQDYVVHYDKYPNIDILPGFTNSMDVEKLDSNMVKAIIENVRRCGYDIIIIDNANSARDTTIVPIMMADVVVLVETLDTTTIQDTINLRDTLRSLQFDFAKIRMVLNMVPTDDKRMDIGIAEVVRVLNMEATAVIPFYDDIRMYNNAGEAAILDKSTPYAVSKEIMRLANSIVPVFDARKKRGMFGRLFDRILGKKV